MSNTTSANEQWTELSASIGFGSEEEMWNKLYVEEKRSIGDLAKHLGFGTATIQRRLEIKGIQRRKRGGANTPARTQEKIFKLDQRFLLFAHPDEIAKLCDCSVHSVYRIRRVM